MKIKEKKTLIYLALGAGALYIAASSSSSSPSSIPSGDTSGDQTPGLLDTIASSITDAVGTLTGTKQQNFIDVMTPIAAQIQEQWGIDPLVTMTQAALESAWGASGLTKKANNLYGYTGDSALNSWLTAKGLPTTTNMQDILKMDTSAAPFIIMQTHEETSAPTVKYFSRPGDLVSQSGSDLMVYRPFRRYDSWTSSVEDWVQLMRNARYAAAWQDALAGDVNAFANDVYAAGYATESDYPVQLVSVADEIAGIQSA